MIQLMRRGVILELVREKKKLNDRVERAEEHIKEGHRI